MLAELPGGGLEGTRAELIVYFASQPFDGPAGTDRHMAHALGRYGPVLFVDPSVSVLTRLRNPLASGVFAAPLQVLGPRIARLVVRVVPGMSRPVLHRLVGPMVARATRAAVQRLFEDAGTGEVAALLSTRVEPLWSALPARRKLFYSTDDLPSGAAILGVSQQRLLRDESLTLRGADAIAVVSPALQERYARAGFSSALIPNGCDPDAYVGVDSAALPADVALPAPVAGFVGHVNDRIDLALLEAVADAGCSLLLVGPVAATYRSAARFAALTRRPNVQWVGAKPFAELPSYLRVIDVGLTPYEDTAFNRASFPLKTLEYLAAGRGVVATPLPANEWLATELIAVASTPADFVARVRAALAERRTPDLAERRRDFTRRHGWDHRAAAIAALLGVDASVPARAGRCV
jgi:teichuronic acid biosynthesis glycosyltransferase TuaH